MGTRGINDHAMRLCMLKIMIYLLIMPLMLLVVPIVRLQNLETNVVEHSGHISGDHSVLVILEKGHGKIGSIRSSNPKPRAISVKGSKEISKSGLKIQKHSKNKGANRLFLQEWAQNISAKLNALVDQTVSESSGPSKVVVNQCRVLESAPPDIMQPMVKLGNSSVLIVLDDQNMVVDQ
ncbi:hypothetical protein V6N13_109852 [Hibiscus sabdariffa]